MRISTKKIPIIMLNTVCKLEDVTYQTILESPGGLGSKIVLNSEHRVRESPTKSRPGLPIGTINFYLLRHGHGMKP